MHVVLPSIWLLFVEAGIPVIQLCPGSPEEKLDQLGNLGKLQWIPGCSVWHKLKLVMYSAIPLQESHT